MLSASLNSSNFSYSQSSLHLTGIAKTGGVGKFYDQLYAVMIFKISIIKVYETCGYGKRL